MDMNFPVDQKELRKFNLRKYKGIPPSWDLIKKVIARSGLKFMLTFENTWGLPEQTLKKCKSGERYLPATYWHIIYDFDIVNQKYRKIKKKRQPLQNNGANIGASKHIINAAKQQLQSAG